MRPNGISLLVPTQNSQKTVEACIRSFSPFADEIIAVDNGSTDDTLSILRRLDSEIPKLQVLSDPRLQHLHENRQMAFACSSYRWIVRIDSDYIAYNKGTRDIRELRQRLLVTKPTVWPVAFTITQVTLYHDPWNMGKPRELRADGGGMHVQPPSEKLNARIIQHYPFMKFQRNGRWEGLRWQRYLRRVVIPSVYWLHCEFKNNHMEFFKRSERTNWREQGDFVRFPTLESYLDFIVRNKYSTDSWQDAAERYMKREVFPYLMEYDPGKFLPYPAELQRMIDNGTV